MANLEVKIPGLLQNYSAGQKTVSVQAETLREVIARLEEKFPGIRFRIMDEQDQLRAHMRIFVNREVVDNLDFPLQDGDQVRLVPAISGG